VQIEVTEYLLSLGAESFVFQFSIQNIILQFSCCFVWVWNLIKIKKNTNRLPLLTHSQNYYICNQTLKRKRRDILMTEENVFCETTNLFPRKNVRAGMKQLLHFTILPGNWPLWRSEILCKILCYSNTSNTAPCSDRLYSFQGTFIQSVVELNAIIFPYIIV